MGSTWRDSVVRLRVDAGVDGSVWGTGFFIAPDLVMTALHVVSPGYEHGDPWGGGFCPVFLASGAASSTATGEESGGAKSPSAAPSTQPTIKLLWPTPGTDHRIDVALLRVDGGKNADFLPLGHVWSKHAEFESYGFPDAQTTLNSIPIHGRSGIPGSTADALADLFVESATLDQSRDWAGVSGSPVYIEGKAVGIVVRRVEQGRQCLKAVPITSVRLATGFSLVPLPKNEALRAALKEHLEPLTETHQFFMNHCKTGGASFWDWVAALSDDEILDVIDKTHATASKVQPTLSLSEIENLVKLASEIRETLAIAICRLQESQAAAGPHGQIIVSAKSWMTVEFIVARRDLRRPKFQSADGSVRELAALFALRDLPECGTNPGPIVAEVRKRLIRIFDCPADADRDYLNGWIASMRQQDDPEENYYYYICLTASDQRSDGNSPIIEALKSEFPALPIYVRRLPRPNDRLRLDEAFVNPKLANVFKRQFKLQQQIMKDKRS